jgi:hypothetical protein
MNENIFSNIYPNHLLAWKGRLQKLPANQGRQNKVHIRVYQKAVSAINQAENSNRSGSLFYFTSLLNYTLNVNKLLVFY